MGRWLFWTGLHGNDWLALKGEIMGLTDAIRAWTSPVDRVPFDYLKGALDSDGYRIRLEKAAQLAVEEGRETGFAVYRILGEEEPRFSGIKKGTKDEVHLSDDPWNMEDFRPVYREIFGTDYREDRSRLGEMECIKRWGTTAEELKRRFTYGFPDDVTALELRQRGNMFYPLVETHFHDEVPVPSRRDLQSLNGRRRGTLEEFGVNTRPIDVIGVPENKRIIMMVIQERTPRPLREGRIERAYKRLPTILAGGPAGKLLFGMQSSKVLSGNGYHVEDLYYDRRNQEVYNLDELRRFADK